MAFILKLKLIYPPLLLLSVPRPIVNSKMWLTNFSFSSSMSNLAAIQSRVSRNALRWPSSVRLWMKRPTRLTARKTRMLAASCCHMSRRSGGSRTRTVTITWIKAIPKEKDAAIQLLKNEQNVNHIISHLIFRIHPACRNTYHRF